MVRQKNNKRGRHEKEGNEKRKKKKRIISVSPKKESNRIWQPLLKLSPDGSHDEGMEIIMDEM